MNNNKPLPAAGIIIDEKIVAIWILQISDTCDYMAAIREVEPEAKYQIDYRFRYYKDDKVFESEDDKSWYRGTISGTRNYAVKGFQFCVRNIAAAGAKGPLYELFNEGDVRAFYERLMNLPPIHARML